MFSSEKQIRVLLLPPDLVFASFVPLVPVLLTITVLLLVFSLVTS